MVIRTLTSLATGIVFLVGVLLLALTTGARPIAFTEIWAALTAFDEQSYQHFIVRHQRLPQAGIAASVGAALAVSGTVLQGLMRNPLASPTILGISSGVTLFTVLFGFALGLPLVWHAPIAFAGGVFGFASALGLARLASDGKDPRGLILILAGALISMLYGAVAQAILLADPALRQEALGWTLGNVNFAYADRLTVLGPISLAAVIGLWWLARPLTSLTLGVEAAAAAGVEAQRLWWLAISLVVIAASAAVAICGPVGFVGLVVPHLVRPFCGANLARAIPVNALFGAVLLIVADVIARSVFAPRVVHTGIVMDMLGGVVFIWLIRRVYLQPNLQTNS